MHVEKSGPDKNSVVYIGLCVWGGGPGSMGGVLFSLEKSKISHIFKLENFQKLLNQCKFYNFLKIYM